MPAPANNSRDCISKTPNTKRGCRVVQIEEHLPRKCEALSTNSTLLPAKREVILLSPSNSNFNAGISSHSTHISWGPTMYRPCSGNSSFCTEPPLYYLPSLILPRTHLLTPYGEFLRLFHSGFQTLAHASPFGGPSFQTISSCQQILT
jgi:hypothetical protein